MSRNEDFRHTTTKALEDRALKFIQSLYPLARKANEENIKETDILFNDEFVDFQFSTKFDRFKEIRFDLVAAGTITASSTKLLLNKMFYDDKSKYASFKDFIDAHIKVKKYGKLLNTTSSSRPHSLLYFIYEKDEKAYKDIKVECPDFIYAVKTDVILDYINKNWKELVTQAKLQFNYRTDSDMYDNLFICIPFKDLEKHNIGYGIDAKLFFSIFNKNN